MLGFTAVPRGHYESWGLTILRGWGWFTGSKKAHLVDDIQTHTEYMIPCIYGNFYLQSSIFQPNVQCTYIFLKAHLKHLCHRIDSSWFHGFKAFRIWDDCVTHQHHRTVAMCFIPTVATWTSTPSGTPMSLAPSRDGKGKSHEVRSILVDSESESQKVDLMIWHGICWFVGGCVFFFLMTYSRILDFSWPKNADFLEPKIWIHWSMYPPALILPKGVGCLLGVKDGPWHHRNLDPDIAKIWKTQPKTTTFFLTCDVFFFSLTWNDNGPNTWFFLPKMTFLLLLGLCSSLFGRFLEGELENPRAGLGTELSWLFRDIALISCPGLPSFPCMVTLWFSSSHRHVINFGCSKIFQAFVR